jgi:hypothetical protein
LWRIKAEWNIVIVIEEEELQVLNLMTRWNIVIVIEEEELQVQRVLA